MKVDSGWGPWELPTTNWGRILQGIFKGTGGGTVSKTLTDQAGASASHSIRQSNGTGPLSAHGGGDPTYVQVGWGNGAAAPARGDFEISGFQARFNCSSDASDEVAATHTVSGSAVSTVATNVTRVGLYLSSSGAARFLIDHATVASVAVAVGETVAVTYEVAY